MKNATLIIGALLIGILLFGCTQKQSSNITNVNYSNNSILGNIYAINALSNESQPTVANKTVVNQTMQIEKPALKTNGTCGEFLSANNFTATVLDAELVKEYVWFNGSKYSNVTAPKDKAFLFVTISLQNNGKIATFDLDHGGSFFLSDFAGNNWWFDGTYGRPLYSSFATPFEFGDLYSGASRIGKLRFTVPSEITGAVLRFDTYASRGCSRNDCPDGQWVSLYWKLDCLKS